MTTREVVYTLVKVEETVQDFIILLRTAHNLKLANALGLEPPI